MRRLKSFVMFWYDFVVGDDWTVAVGVVAALGGTALLVHGGQSGWWLLPVVVVVLLGWSLWRAARRTSA